MNVWISCAVNRSVVSLALDEADIQFFMNVEFAVGAGIIVGGVGDKGEILKKTDRLEEAYDLGRSLV